MAFNGTEGTFISISQGAALTQKYRANFLKGNVERKALFFGREKLEAILAQENCEGLRIYFGAVEEGEPGNNWEELELVIVGADASEKDQLGENDQILDYGTPCPMQCDTNSPLNS